MRKSKFSDHQIIDAIKRVEGGLPVKDLCRELGISDAAFYKWRSKYGSMEAFDLKCLREVEEDNRLLKQVYADLSLEHRIMKHVVEGKL